MTEKLKQTIKEETMKLPKDMQDAINSLDWARLTEKIGKENLLTENEVHDLQVETMLVLVGLEDITSYARNIENNVETSKNEATKIADEIYKQVFTPIREALQENIKKNLGSKNENWKQTLNFVLSGGNYSAFIEDRDSTPPTKPPNVNISTRPSRISDIKSKFVI